MSCQIIDLTVGEWLQLHQAEPVLVSADMPLKHVAEQMLIRGHRDAYVAREQTILGHLNFNKVINHLFAHERPIHTHRQLFACVTEATAAELMDPHYAYCRENEVLSDVLHRQLESDIDDLIVLSSDSMLCGVIVLNELVRESLK